MNDEQYFKLLKDLKFLNYRIEQIDCSTEHLQSAINEMEQDLRESYIAEEKPLTKADEHLQAAIETMKQDLREASKTDFDKVMEMFASCDVPCRAHTNIHTTMKEIEIGSSDLGGIICYAFNEYNKLVTIVQEIYSHETWVNTLIIKGDIDD